VPDAPGTNTDSGMVSLPSRVVENLYWMGRYAERGEAGLRLLRTVFVLLNGEVPVTLEAKRILLQAVTQVTATQPGFVDAPKTLLASPDEELLRVIQDGGRVGSIKFTLNSMLASAEESKELLSTDTLRVINALHDELDGLDVALAGGLASAPEEALDPLVTCLVALAGLMQENMVRSVGWRFMELGKRVERAEQIITTLRVLTAPVAGEADRSTLLLALLTTMDIVITYRRRGRQRAGIELALELIMLDSSNPRSLLFQLERLQQHLVELPGMRPGASALEEEERTLLGAATTLKLARLPQLLAVAQGKRPAMEELLAELDRLLLDFNTLISDKHFDHRTDAQQLLATVFGGAN
ncbi:MAG: alpha-E domain-containing protein, partial [Halioglobus sp.]|nr:alpha-E domain-containing protein [Halioglobus sp.]